MFSPRPLPSVFREASPRTKRSISSSALMFSSSREIFFREIITFPSTWAISTYSRVPGSAYFTAFCSRLDSVRHTSRPSARIITGDSGHRTTGIRGTAASLSANSPSAWFTASTASISVISTFIFPVVALLMSIRSSMNFFIRPDCRESTARYSSPCSWE